MSQTARFALVGDVLFQGSIRPTDHPMATTSRVGAIKEKLLPLGDDVSFLCGHGAASTDWCRAGKPIRFCDGFPARSPSAPLTFATGPPTACYALIAEGAAGRGAWGGRPQGALAS